MFSGVGAGADEFACASAAETRDAAASPAAPRTHNPSNINALLQCEGPDRTPRRDLRQVGITTERCVDGRRSTRHGDVLLALVFPGDRQAGDAGPCLELPEFLAAGRIEREELAGLRAGE